MPLLTNANRRRILEILQLRRAGYASSSTRSDARERKVGECEFVVGFGVEAPVVEAGDF